MHSLSQAIIVRLQQENVGMNESSFSNAVTKTLGMVPDGYYKSYQEKH